MRKDAPDKSSQLLLRACDRCSSLELPPFLPTNDGHEGASYLALGSCQQFKYFARSMSLEACHHLGGMSRYPLSALLDVADSDVWPSFYGSNSGDWAAACWISPASRWEDAILREMGADAAERVDSNENIAFALQKPRRTKSSRRLKLSMGWGCSPCTVNVDELDFARPDGEDLSLIRLSRRREASVGGLPAYTRYQSDLGVGCYESRETWENGMFGAYYHVSDASTGVIRAPTCVLCRFKLARGGVEMNQLMIQIHPVGGGILALSATTSHFDRYLDYHATQLRTDLESIFQKALAR
jgi:hypothetical protein